MDPPTKVNSPTIEPMARADTQVWMECCTVGHKVGSFVGLSVGKPTGSAAKDVVGKRRRLGELEGEVGTLTEGLPVNG